MRRSSDTWLGHGPSSNAFNAASASSSLGGGDGHSDSSMGNSVMGVGGRRHDIKAVFHIHVKYCVKTSQSWDHMSSEPHVRDRQYSVVVRTGDVTPINHPEKLPPIPYSNYLPSILKSNMGGKWVDHRMITPPAIMEHVAESGGDRVFTIKVIGPPNARYSADTLEKLCDLADTYGIAGQAHAPGGEPRDNN